MIITRCENCHCLADIAKMTSVTLLVRRPEGFALANEAMTGMMEAIAKSAPPGAMIIPDHEPEVPKSAPLAVNAVLCGVCYRGILVDGDGRAPTCEVVDYPPEEGNDHVH